MNDKFKEHTYRRSLQEFIEEICPFLVLNDEARVMNVDTKRCPDLIIYHRDTNNEVGYIETKAIKTDLEDVLHTDQIVECIEVFDSFILTNYIDFRFYRKGKEFHCLNIGVIAEKRIISHENNFEKFYLLISDQFEKIQPIINLKSLIDLLVIKAKIIRTKTLHLLEKDKALRSIYEYFKTYIISDITRKEFVNLFAQTIVYGLLIAKYNSPEPRFNLKIAKEAVSKSSDFFCGLFNLIMQDYSIEKQILIDPVFKILDKCDIKGLFENSDEYSDDRFILLYEYFLQKYDSTERKKLGVWYTPRKIVKYIVKTVDKILITEFSIPSGLADIESNKNDQEVRILDPAVGTGTFLYEVLDYVKHSKTFQDGGGYMARISEGKPTTKTLWI